VPLVGVELVGRDRYPFPSTEPAEAAARRAGEAKATAFGAVAALRTLAERIAEANEALEPAAERARITAAREECDASDAAGSSALSTAIEGLGDGATETLAATRAFQHFGAEGRLVPERGRRLFNRLKEQGLHVYHGTELRRR
jgi:hypothetical protein